MIPQEVYKKHIDKLFTEYDNINKYLTGPLKRVRLRELRARLDKVNINLNVNQVSSNDWRVEYSKRVQQILKQIENI